MSIPVISGLGQASKAVGDAVEKVADTASQAVEKVTDAFEHTKVTDNVVGHGVAGFVEGLADFPIGLVGLAGGVLNGSLEKAAMHPVQTVKAMGQELAQAWHDDAAHTIGRGLGWVAIPAGGVWARAGKVAKGVDIAAATESPQARVASAAGDAARAEGQSTLWGDELERLPPGQHTGPVARFSKVPALFSVAFDPVKTPEVERMVQYARARLPQGTKLSVSDVKVWLTDPCAANPESMEAVQLPGGRWTVPGEAVETLKLDRAQVTLEASYQGRSMPIPVDISAPQPAASAIPLLAAMDPGAAALDEKLGAIFEGLPSEAQEAIRRAGMTPTVTRLTYLPKYGAARTVEVPAGKNWGALVPNEARVLAAEADWGPIKGMKFNLGDAPAAIQAEKQSLLHFDVADCPQVKPALNGGATLDGIYIEADDGTGEFIPASEQVGADWPTSLRGGRYHMKITAVLNNPDGVSQRFIENPGGPLGREGDGFVVTTREPPVQIMRGELNELKALGQEATVKAVTYRVGGEPQQAIVDAGQDWEKLIPAGAQLDEVLVETSAGTQAYTFAAAATDG